MNEVPVLERAGEERPRRCDSLELGAVVAEADDDGARAGLAEGIEKEMDTLVVEELAEVENGRLVTLEPGREPLGIAFIRQPLFGVRGVRRVAAGLLQQPSERLRSRLGGELLDVDAGRHLVHAVDVADDLLEH